jgi:hypothetical protein
MSPLPSAVGAAMLSVALPLTYCKDRFFPFYILTSFDERLSARVKACRATENLGHQRKGHKETVGNKEHHIQKNERDTPEPTLQEETENENNE